ncbi:hypothetical protein F5Y05DRAFT_410982 [Hypoxylon sp. FL0543]|nr:hypothetical protein F5Y05DRAFT_410982 [Hypoxylon sp. FL0543]
MDTDRKGYKLMGLLVISILLGYLAETLWLVSRRPRQLRRWFWRWFRQPSPEPSMEHQYTLQNPNRIAHAASIGATPAPTVEQQLGDEGPFGLEEIGRQLDGLEESEEERGPLLQAAAQPHQRLSGRNTMALSSAPTCTNPASSLRLSSTTLQAVEPPHLHTSPEMNLQ